MRAQRAEDLLFVVILMLQRAKRAEDLLFVVILMLQRAKRAEDLLFRLRLFSRRSKSPTRIIRTIRILRIAPRQVERATHQHKQPRPSGLHRDVNVRSQQINDIAAEQNRIRENMKTVAQSTQYYERLLSKLNEQESSIESLEGERAALTTKRDAARKNLDDYVSTLTIQ